MWRSFFYAVGIGLFALGLQALVLDHVLVPKDTRVQKLIRKILEDDKPKAAKAQNVSPQIARNQQPAWNQNNQGFNTGSRFGPSRFSGPAYGVGYGGSRVNGTPSARFAGYRPGSNPSSASGKPVALQQLVIREWMPWSLLAVGAIIFLYTHTHQKRGSHD